MKKRAYISVFDKTGIVEFAQKLIKAEFEIVSTGGTFDLLTQNGINAVESADITGFRELIGGKVKSLHPKIFAGILADLNERESLIKEDIQVFDLVCVNLYPFENYKGKDTDIETLIKNIDIGGVALLRAGAKNYENITVISDIKDYDIDIQNINLETREKLAVKAFSLTSKYDFLIADELQKRFAIKEDTDGVPEFKAFYLDKIEDLRYGENPHQTAALYNYEKTIDYEFLNGKEFSHNNIIDATAALNIAAEFYDVNAAVIIKHTNPCGVALGKTLKEAWEKALDCDPLSAFGGIVAFTGKVDLEIAKLLTAMFLEVVIAPDFTDEAVEELKKKKNLRILKLKNLDARDAKYDIKYLEGKVLVQELNTKMIDEMKVVTNAQPTQSQLDDMEFGMKVVKYVKSNAICIVKNGVTLAIGGGQTSRVWALENAIHNNPDKDFKDAVLASDAFFPFNDCAQVAIDVGIRAIVQPGGSVRDQDSIDLCNEHDVPMVFSGYRHFRH